jgi:hypothetical protein
LVFGKATNGEERVKEIERRVMENTRVPMTFKLADYAEKEQKPLPFAFLDVIQKQEKPKKWFWEK